MNITIRRNSIVAPLFIVVSLLFAAHFTGLIWEGYLGQTAGHDLIKKFNVNEEGNVPTWFSSAMLLLSAFLLGLIGVCKKKTNDRFARHWIFLALVFVFLSCDETAQIHELSAGYVNRVVNFEFTRFIGWIIPFGVLLLAFAFAYMRFFFHLPNRIKVLFASSGFVYVGGALGMEILTGAFGRAIYEGRLHFLFDVVEEIFEMSGMFLFIYSLLTYLSSDFGALEIHFVTTRSNDDL